MRVIGSRDCIEIIAQGYIRIILGYVGVIGCSDYRRIIY